VVIEVRRKLLSIAVVDEIIDSVYFVAAMAAADDSTDGVYLV
jgi:hypothetical protein